MNKAITPLPHNSGHVFSLPFGKSSVVICLFAKRPPHWEKDTLGMCQGNDWMEGELPASICTIELLVKSCGAGYVTHEFTHALLGYMQILGWKPNDDHFEEACYAIGDAVALFWNEFYKLYPEEKLT